MSVLSLTLASLRHQSRQFLAPGLAVVLGVAFVAATLVLTGTMDASMRQAVAGQYASYSSVVVPPTGEEQVAADVAEEVAEVRGVDTVDPVRTGSGLIGGSGDPSFGMFTTESTLAPHPVVEGRAPKAATEIALSETVAAGTQLEVGDTVPVSPASGTADRPTEATVVGVLDVTDDPRYGGGTPAVFATPEGVSTMTGAKGWSEISVVADGGEEAATSAIASALSAKGVDARVRTATEHADEQVTAFTGGVDFLSAFFLAFAVIALFVSTIVIANTFAILLARRARETALLRAVGATRAQVVRSSLVEALVIGLTFSVVGVLVGIGLAWALVQAGSAVAGDALPELVLTVPVRAVGLPVLAGVLVVLVAALRPALRSSRVAPLEALRPDAAITARSRSGRLRIAGGTLLALLGGAALVAGGELPSVGIGVVGGLVSFTGILLVGTVMVPWVVRLVGLVAARPFGAAGRLAIDNAVRNPARAASTASALLVGVTLVTMTAVGAATARTTITDFINSQYPVDVVVEGRQVPDSTATAIDGVDGVAASTRLAGTDVTAAGPGPGGTEATVAAVPEDLEEVVRDRAALPTADDGTVVVAEEDAEMAGLANGDEIRLRGIGGATTATVEVDGAFETAWLVTPATLAKLDARPTTSAVLVRLEDSADVTTAVDRIKELGAGVDQGSVGGGAPVRAANMQALDVALALVLALLAISVLIAVVGIANTLSLSVIERTRESALMRALGLTRGQLRAMLGIEAVLLSLAGVVVGTVLGTVYGLTGVRSLFGEFVSVTPSLPWTQLGLVALVAVLAGLLASVLPARRAAKVAPAQALAAE